MPKRWARPSGPALVASPSNPQAVSTEGFDPPRDFVPAELTGKPRNMPKRERQELDAMLHAARRYMKELTPFRKQMLLGAFADVSPINCSWQHYGLAKIFVYELDAIATEAGTAATENTDAVHEGAGPQDIAQ